MTGGKVGQCGVSGKNPKAVNIATEGLNARLSIHVPYSDGAVFGDRENEVTRRMEEAGRDVAKVSTAGACIPGTRFAHAPEFDEVVVTARDDERKCRMERSPVDATVVSFEDIFDDDVRERVVG
jgi:hypothetical protein